MLDEGTAAVAPDIRVERDAGVVVLALVGEHDVSTRHRARETIDTAQAAQLPVVVDLREATFVDSVIAATLIEARKRAQRENIGLGIVLSAEHRNPVRRMFELSQLTTVFAIYPSVDDAVTAVREGFVAATTP